MSGAPITVLWCPFGQAELDLIAQTDYRCFPPRLPEQPIFYSVCNEEYACEMAEKWNARNQGVGFVTRFEERAHLKLRAEFLSHVRYNGEGPFEFLISSGVRATFCERQGALPPEPIVLGGARQIRKP